MRKSMPDTAIKPQWSGWSGWSGRRTICPDHDGWSGRPLIYIGPSVPTNHPSFLPSKSTTTVPTIARDHGVAFRTLLDRRLVCDNDRGDGQVPVSTPREIET